MAWRRVTEPFAYVSPSPEGATPDPPDTLRELELAARLAELDRSIRALERERERFLRLRYSIHLIEAELLHLRAERAEIRAELRARRAAGPELRKASSSLRVRLASLALGALVTLGVAAMAFRANSEPRAIAQPTATGASSAASSSAAAPEAALSATTAPQGGAFVPASPATPTPRPVRYAVVTAQQLNVRIGPGLQYAIRRAVPAGTVLTLVRERRDEAGDVWWELEQGGWVHGGYVQFAASEAEARSAAERLP